MARSDGSVVRAGRHVASGGIPYRPARYGHRHPFAGAHGVGHQELLPLSGGRRCANRRSVGAARHPSAGRKLPEVLSIDEVDAMFAAIDMGVGHEPAQPRA